MKSADRVIFFHHSSHKIFNSMFFLLQHLRAPRAHRGPLEQTDKLALRLVWYYKLPSAIMQIHWLSLVGMVIWKLHIFFSINYILIELITNKYLIVRTLWTSCPMYNKIICVWLFSLLIPVHMFREVQDNRD